MSESPIDPELSEFFPNCNSTALADSFLETCDKPYCKTNDSKAVAATFGTLYDLVHRHLGKSRIKEFVEAIDGSFDSGAHNAWYQSQD